MAEKEKQILETISKALPQLTETQKEKLLAFSEGVAYVAGAREKEAGETA